MGSAEGPTAPWTRRPSAGRSTPRRCRSCSSRCTAAGRLELSREGVTKRVWLRDGVPVLAESNLPSESLGIQLLDAGRITREDYARVVETVRERRCKEGAALLALGLVGPQDLFAA